MDQLKQQEEKGGKFEGEKIFTSCTNHSAVAQIVVGCRLKTVKIGDSCFLKQDVFSLKSTVQFPHTIIHTLDLPLLESFEIKKKTMNMMTNMQIVNCPSLTKFICEKESLVSLKTFIVEQVHEDFNFYHITEKERKEVEFTDGEEKSLFPQLQNFFYNQQKFTKLKLFPDKNQKYGQNRALSMQIRSSFHCINTETQTETQTESQNSDQIKTA